MKKALLVSIRTIVVVGATLVSCSTSNEPSKHVQRMEAYEEEVQKYRKKTAKNTSGNELGIVEFNARIANRRKYGRQGYDDKIALWLNLNEEVKTKFNDFTWENHWNWEGINYAFAIELDEIIRIFHRLNTHLFQQEERDAIL